MAKYYVNQMAQPNGDHEVHRLGCAFFPKVENLKNLGEFPGCAEAVREAGKYYTKVDGCFYCSWECHKG